MRRLACGQEASQSLARTAELGLDRTGWELGRERGSLCEVEEGDSFSGVPRFSSLLHQAAGDVVQHLLVCSCPLTPSLNHLPTSK